MSPKIKKKTIVLKKDKKVYNKEDPSYEDLCELIDRNLYIKDVTSNPKKDTNSLSYIVKSAVSQSDCIKLGHAVENVFSDAVLKLSSLNLKNIKQKNKKGEKERDHLFCDEKNKIIFYSELKSNLNLDTEKSKTTYTKCLDIVNELKEEFPDYEIRWCLFACRYLLYEDIPSVIKRKYTPISENVFGVNQYMSMMGINYVFSEENYVKLLNYIGDKMFKKDLEN